METITWRYSLVRPRALPYCTTIKGKQRLRRLSGLSNALPLEPAPGVAP